MSVKLFGSETEAKSCEGFLKEHGLSPSLTQAPGPEGSWILRFDDSRMSAEARLAFQKFSHATAVDRQRYLGKLQVEFEQTDLVLLEKRWNDRENLDADMVERLLQVIREKKGLNNTKAVLPQVCAQCHMVGDACTCTRSWF